MDLKKVDESNPEQHIRYWKSIALGYKKLSEHKFDIIDRYTPDDKDKALQWKRVALAYKQLHEKLI